jgi:hypothetical protein
MEEKIISLLGNNHTKPISFNDVKLYEEVYGLYTYKGKAYCLKAGMDIDFGELPGEEQNKVLKLVESKNWIISPALQ